MQNRPLHILYIDDDDVEIEIFEMSLKQTGFIFDYQYALSAETGIEILQGYSPDYIFLDINMPKINVFDCIKRIRSDNRFNKIPVIFFSSDIDEDIYNKALSLGANGSIRKTFGQQLTTTLKELFATNQK